MFDYADELRRPDRLTREQSIAKMINRLRVVTGQNFGYDPDHPPEQRQQAISAWQKWYKENRTFLMDLVLMLVTAWVVINPRSEILRTLYPGIPEKDIRRFGTPAGQPGDTE